MTAVRERKLAIRLVPGTAKEAPAGEVTELTVGAGDELKRLYVFRSDLQTMMQADVMALATQLAEFDEAGHLLLLPLGAEFELYEVLDGEPS